jgi:hypothetical protein
MVCGSFLALNISPLVHFFLAVGNFVRTYLAEKWEGRMPHHGESVSNSNRSTGISLTTPQFNSVFSELPIQNSITQPNRVMAIKNHN